MSIVAPHKGHAAPVGPPLWLLAELTYRCPLHCVFCYNPVDFARDEAELSTEDWLRVLGEARALGAVQCGFSGGEPLQRDDLEILVAEARRLGVKALDGLPVDRRDGIPGYATTGGESCPDASDGGEAECDTSSLDHLMPEKGDVDVQGRG